MNHTNLSENLFETRFALKQMPPSKVAEISKATAESGCPAEERINLHIGNPVQDPRLDEMYAGLVFGKTFENVKGSYRQQILKNISNPVRQELAQLLIETIEKANPYMPSGGFNPKKPGSLIRQLHAWLTVGQDEPLEYSLGEAGALPEIAITGGGKTETLKLLFQLIEEKLKGPYKNIISLETVLSACVTRAYHGQTTTLQGDENRLLAQIGALVENLENRFGFIIFHKIYTREFRKKLATLAARQNLMLFEANDAANAYSLARNPGMARRLLRIVTPQAIDPRLANTSICLVLGNANYIDGLNLFHFLKKGSPSATEVKLLSFLLDNKDRFNKARPSELSKNYPVTSTARKNFNDINYSPIVDRSPFSDLQLYEKSIAGISLQAEKIAAKASQRIENLSSELSQRFDLLVKRIFRNHCADNLGGKSVWEVIEAFFANPNRVEFTEQLQQAFVAQFAKVHPEFESANMIALSGSARAALSSAAEAWGITEAILPDLSWTIGDAIEKITAAPLNADLTISAENIIRTLSAKLDADKEWIQHGCVVLNNPQNATGKITPDDEIQKILSYCLSNRVKVIDDLSYSNVIIASPEERAKIYPIKNCRELLNQLIGSGILPQAALRNLITIRSISKTDCKAGARLCVIEIPDNKLRWQFKTTISAVEPNRMALLLSYLFYRNGIDKLNEFWSLRDRIMWDRMQAFSAGFAEIPASENKYGIRLVTPQGAMYPHLVVEHLPENVIVDDLSSKLAVKGIGLIPMTNFAHTDSSFKIATRTFRMTLGGPANTQRLKKQSARLVAELTNSIQRIAYDYTLYSPVNRALTVQKSDQASVDLFINECKKRFNQYWQKVEALAGESIRAKWPTRERPKDNSTSTNDDFISAFLPKRKAVFLAKLEDRAKLLGSLREKFAIDEFQQQIVRKFELEIGCTTEAVRREQFQNRLFDRTVHPTQSYSLNVEKLASKIISTILNENSGAVPAPKIFLKELIDEYGGENIAIKSADEAEEAICDLEMLTLVEDFGYYFYDTDLNLTLSFWGDWDGSQRPSGQGHTLVASALLTNVLRLTELARFFETQGLLDEANRAVLAEVGPVEKKIKKFRKILKNINELTTELEARIRKHLDAIERPGWLLRKLRKLGLARDPIQVMWKHNDRNERRMQAYRRARSSEILRFFKINHQLSELMRRLPDVIGQQRHNPALQEQLATYKNPLKRFYLTPRIHQKIITSSDPFTIDTTVYNLVEINKMGAMFGYPGLVLSLQVSMTNRADAIIRLDKKLRAEWERVVRENPEIQPVQIRIVPLFEEIEILQNLEAFLDEIWEYAEESKNLDQPAQDRFCEIIGEFFVAGSDLSQQVSQTQALVLFKQAKACINTYLLKKGLAGRIRIKFGSGESAQRQGGYFDTYAAQKALQLVDPHSIIEQLKVDGFTAAALFRARSPLNGIFSTSDFRTFQSNIMENLRQLPANELVQAFYHIRFVQQDYEQAVKNVTETYWGSRRQLQQEMLAQLEVLMKGQLSPTYLEFAELVKKNFGHILYGSAEDMAGIHVVSLFLSRALVSMRDRPTVRPTKETGEDRGRQIVERLSGTLPLSEHGTMLRAIGHNKAQTMILGINQVSTGLFRAMREFIGRTGNTDEQLFKLRKEILPHLPVKDILNTLRLYHEPGLSYLKKLEPAFPPGNTSLKTLHEEQRVMGELIPYLQEELLRRNGLEMLPRRTDGKGLLPSEALRCIRPDLAVLLQPDIFNIQIENIFGKIAKDETNLNTLREELSKRETIAATQRAVWEFMQTPITEQVISFFELAQAIKALRQEGSVAWPKLNVVSRSQVSKLGSEVNRMLRNVADDSMRQFLISAVQYLLYLPETVEDIPEAVLIALRDVQKILSLDEQALSKPDQQYLHFLFLKIARIGGDCG